MHHYVAENVINILAHTCLTHHILPLLISQQQFAICSKSIQKNIPPEGKPARERPSLDSPVPGLLLGGTLSLFLLLPNFRVPTPDSFQHGPAGA